jgi:hypothetical protein
MRLRRIATALCAALSLSLIAPTAALADTVDPTTDSNVTAIDVDHALDAIGVTDDSAAVKTSSDADSAAVTTAGGTQTDIPKDASDGINVTAKNGDSLTITPENADDAAAGKVVSPGVVAYPNDNGSATAVQAESDGSTRFLTIIANADAPTEYAYKVSIPDGGKVVTTGDGGAAILDSGGQLMSTVPAPWAKDAHDQSVPTHFVVENNSLTQVVDHTSGDFAYPVTADPRITWSWSGYTIHLNRDETYYLAIGATAALGYRVSGPTAAALVASGGAWVGDQARARGYCVAAWHSYYWTWWFSVYIERC